MLHTALEGNSAHATHAPCSLDELHAKGYHYMALAHVHEHQIWEMEMGLVLATWKVDFMIDNSFARTHCRV